MAGNNQWAQNDKICDSSGSLNGRPRERKKNFNHVVISQMDL